MTRAHRYTGVAAAATLGLLLSALPAAAVPTATYEAGTFKELDKGKPTGTLVSSQGEVRAGRQALRVKGVGAGLIYASARIGKTVYFGTGAPPSIIAVAGGSARVVAKLGEPAALVTSLIATPAGKLVAGVMPTAASGATKKPRALLIEIDPGSGKTRKLAELPSSHVWALLLSSGRIYAGCGAPGKVYKVPTGGGKPTVYYDTGEHHVLSLALDASGKLLAGSNNKAIIYRILKRGRAVALHDFAATEVRDIVVTRTGRTYVAVNKFRRKVGGLPRFDRTRGSASGTKIKKGRVRKKTGYRASELRPGAKTGQGALYRIEADGHVRQLLALPKGYFTRLALDEQGRVWAADGTKGRIYQIRRNGDVLTIFDLHERQVSALALSANPQFVGTSDAGAVYRVDRGAQRPRYLSRVIDTKFVSDWGALLYRATGKLSWSSRSGNTAKPDKTWTAWRRNRRGAGKRSRVTSPRARYLQVRAEWSGPTSKTILRSFKLFYRPQNQRARIKSIEISRPKVRGNKPRTPVIKLKWKVDNPDKDPLVYRLFYRAENGVDWRRIRTGKPLTKTTFKWDTETIPDGTYRVRVVASDERANAPELTQRGKRVSAPVLIDNRRPAVVGLTVRDPWIAGMARDTYSHIKRVEYSIDGRPFRLVGASDGIFDSPTEPFRVRLPRRLRRGWHVVTVRAYDGANNVGVQQLRFAK